MPTRLCIVYGCFHITVAEMGSYDRDHMGHKAKNIYYVNIVQKCVPTTALGRTMSISRTATLPWDKQDFFP